ncbi:SUKH-3 domain-containing protein [Streptomyces sp. NPDC014889]|uniref:SUKH-3 domain-containing protein n=1 Tax=Streptomyces sp. NPDC014889 TaxID=3364928 RepID=UPI00370355BE
MIASCFELGAGPVMSERSPEVLKVLEVSGWTAGRRVDTTGWRSRFDAVGIVMHDAAEKFLQEFVSPGVRRADREYRRPGNQPRPGTIRAGPGAGLGRE